MKKLILIRHGKSEKDDSNDFDRKLNKRGVADSELLGQCIYKLEGSPHMVVSSPAPRAKETASIIADKCYYDSVIEEFDFIYPGNLHEFQTMLEMLDNSIDYVIITGHNPFCEEAASFISGKNDNLLHMPTSSAVCFTSEETSWKRFLDEKTHQIEWILTPKFIEIIKKL